MNSAQPLSTKNHRLVRLLLDWFTRHARDLPWRNTSNPYAIWISEIMLQQTQVKTVIPYWERWMRALPTVQSLADAPQERVLKLWEGLGYYTRARNLQKAAQLICNQHRGIFPAHFDDVLALPGIGRYTAGAICSIAYNQPTPILDGNVIRVLTRLYAINGNPREKQTNTQLWSLAEELVGLANKKKSANKSSASPSSRPLCETKQCSFLNQSLMELGALICTPRQPGCADCPVQSHCAAFQQNRVEDFPNLEKRVEATKRRFIAFIVERDKKFLVRQRPANIVNAHLWEFPNIEVNGDSGVSGTPPFRISHPTPVCTIQHSITRYRIRLEAFRASLPARQKQLDGKWFTLAQMEQLAFSSAHRKILQALT